MQLLKEVDGESDWFSARKVLPRHRCDCVAMAGDVCVGDWVGECVSVSVYGSM